MRRLPPQRWGGPLAPADPEGLAAAGDAFDLVTTPCSALASIGQSTACRVR